jgi:hypothetical protein
MAQMDYSFIFRCPKCNFVGAIYLLKYTLKKTIIKQNCPIHGKRSFVIPSASIERLIPIIRDSIYRCYKCGKITKIANIKTSGQWTLIRGECEDHRHSLPYQKVSTLIYNKLNSYTQEETILNNKKMYCHNCGCQIQIDQKTCNLCGAAIHR